MTTVSYEKNGNTVTRAFFSNKEAARYFGSEARKCDIKAMLKPERRAQYMEDKKKYLFLRDTYLDNRR